MKNLTLLALLSLSSIPAFADVDPEYFCHDLRGYSAGENNDVYSNIATFWKNRDGLYELRVAGPNLAPGLVVPKKAEVRYIRSVTAVFGVDDCSISGDSARSCHRVTDEEASPIWIWGDNDAIDAQVHKVSREDPESFVKAGSIKAEFDADDLSLTFTTIEGRSYAIQVSCDAPSWDWYPHVPLEELDATAH